MSISLFNTLTKKKEKFLPTEKDSVKIYSCGPTVYNFAHIGNFRAYVSADILQRFLRFKGFKVKWVMNITDIDDKTIRDSQKKYPKEDPESALNKFTSYYEKAFFEDLETLKIKKDNFHKNPCALNYIDSMQSLIRKIFANGFAYENEGSIYFDVKSFSEKNDYGVLKNIDMKNFRATRIKEDDGKQDLADFVLWKAKKEGEPFWDFEIDGQSLPGRPGWHIECSAMGEEIFPGGFDIHTGGVDLIFPHHENEVAQSKAGYGHGIAKIWFHNEYLTVNSEKMAKSKDNFFLVRDILDKSYSPNVIRFFLLSVHYRAKLDFNEENLINAKSAVDKINNFYLNFLDLREEKESKENEEIKELSKSTLINFEKALDDDLNISKALSFLFSFISDINKFSANKESLGKKTKKRVVETLEKIDEVLAILQKEKREIPEEIIKLAEERNRFRKEKKWQEADRLRDELLSRGYLVKDKEGGFDIVLR